MIQETTGINRIEAVFKSLLRDITEGEPVLNERSPSARPKDSAFTTFMVYWTEGAAHVYKGCYEKDDGRFVQRVQDDAYITARVVCYGCDSMRRANGIRMTLNSDIPSILAVRDIIGICDIDDVQSIPEPDVDGSVRERAYFNFKFYARIAYEFDMDWYNKITLVLSVPEKSFTSETEIEGTE